MQEAPNVFRVGPDSDEVLAACAAIHEAEIPGGFLPSMGPTFLVEMYRAIASEPNTFLFASELDGTVGGFVCGSAGAASPIKMMLRGHPMRVALAIAPRLLSISNLRHALETIRYMGQDDESSFGFLPSAEILNFAVSAAFQGAGIGQGLFKELCNEFRLRRVKQIKIVTGEDQVTAQRFYEMAGANKLGNVAVHQGTQSILYTYRIKERE